MTEPPSRRAFLELSAGAAVLAIAPACSRRDPPAPVADAAVVRVTSVPTAVEGDLLPALVRDFPAGIRATRYPTDERVCWMPAGRHNRTAVLPLG